MSATAGPLEARLAAEGVNAWRLNCATATEQDLDETVRLARESTADWVILDGYRFDSAFQSGIREAGFRLMVIDDFGQAGEYAARVILDQNLAAREEDYRRRDPGARLLLGLKYAMLRREFRACAAWTRKTPEVAQRVLVTLGGAAPEESVRVCLQAINGMADPPLAARIILGPLSGNVGEHLKETIEAASPRCQVIESVSNMAELIAWADLAISAGGSTCWELAFMGLPALILTYSRHQEPIAKGLQGADAAIWMGSGASVSENGLRAAIQDLARDKERRLRMSRGGRTLVDGQGAERVLSALVNVALTGGPREHPMRRRPS
jgi:spore coat polysaccharide biosynthesis predicted glycosyltransferase SpsG